MITRFVYPKIDMFYKNRNLKGAIQLLISSTSDDGKCWYGTRDAIENYCEEYGCDIQNVQWYVLVKPDDDDYAEIIAKNLDDWERQFNDLKVQYQEIPER